MGDSQPAGGTVAVVTATPRRPVLSHIAVPLTVAAAAAVLGGLGNVAFSLHSGSQLGLASVRYLLGVAMATAWLHLRRTPTVATGRAGPTVAVLGSSSPILLMQAADHVSTAPFTLISTLVPVLVLLGGRLLGTRRAGPLQALLAAVAVGASAAAVLYNLPVEASSQQASRTGVLLAVGAAVALSASFLAASTLPHVPPAQLLRDLCIAGTLLCGILAAAGVPVRVTPSTVAAAAFLAAGPGGVAKAAQLWAVSRTAPALVAAVASFAVVPAAIGGIVLLGQSVTPAAAVAGLLATCAVALLCAAPTPDTEPARERPRRSDPQPKTQ